VTDRISRVLWRRLDGPGHDAAELSALSDGWRLSGCAVFLDDDGLPSRLDYAVTCDASWRTTAAQVHGWAGRAEVALAIAVDAEQRWSVNGAPCPDVTGCIDVDLAFTPATNLLPIRRLQPAVGVAASLDAAWLEFPSFRLQRLDQVYRRTAQDRYRFESGGGSFTADLVVNDASWVVDYPQLWQLIGAT
jgi:hypothetical protein